MPSPAASKGNCASNGAISAELAATRAVVNTSFAEEGKQSQDPVFTFPSLRLARPAKLKMDNTTAETFANNSNFKSKLKHIDSDPPEVGAGTLYHAHRRPGTCQHKAQYRRHLYQDPKCSRLNFSAWINYDSHRS